MSAMGVAVAGALGGILGLDVVGFPQAMLSRPLVAATLAGAFAGAPMRGFLLGVALECFALETLPVGASRYPEWGSSSVVGGTLVALPTPRPWASLLVALVVAVAWAWLGGWSMVQLRRLNAHWARARHAAVARGARRVVVGLQLFGLTADLLRGATLAAVGVLVGAPLLAACVAAWRLPEGPTRDVVALVAGAVAVSGVVKVFHGVTHALRLFVGAAAVTLLWLALA